MAYVDFCPIPAMPGMGGEIRVVPAFFSPDGTLIEDLEVLASDSARTRHRRHDRRHHPRHLRLPAEDWCGDRLHAPDRLRWRRHRDVRQVAAAGVNLTPTAAQYLPGVLHTAAISRPLPMAIIAIVLNQVLPEDI